MNIINAVITIRKDKIIKKELNYFILLLKYSYFILTRKLHFFYEKIELNFKKNMINKNGKETLKIFSYFKLSQYYYLQSFYLPKIIPIFLVFVNIKPSNCFIQKVEDIILQNVYQKFEQFFNYKNRNINELTFDSLNFKLFKKWSYILYLDQNKCTNLAKNSCYFSKNLKFNIKNFKKNIIYFNDNTSCKKNLYVKLTNYLLDLKNKFEVLYIAIFFVSISLYGDIYLEIGCYEIFSFFKKSRYFISSFLLFILNHSSLRIICPGMFLQHSLIYSFKIEKSLNFLSNEKLIKIFNNKLLHLEKCVSRGFVIRLMKIFNLFGRFCQKFLGETVLVDTIGFTGIKKRYSSLIFLNYYYLKKFKQSLKNNEKQTKIRNILFLIGKVKLILLRKNLNNFQTQKYLRFFILLTTLIIKNQSLKIGITNITYRLKMLEKNNIPLTIPFSIKLAIICICILESSFSTISVHEILFTRIIFYLKNKLSRKIIRNNYKIFDKNIFNCTVIQKIKKLSSYKIYNENPLCLKKNLYLKERLGLGYFRFIEPILNKKNFHEKKVQYKFKLKFSLIESLISLLLFFKIPLLISSYRLIPLNFYLKKSKKSKLSLKFCSYKNHYKMQINGACLFCFTKKKNSNRKFLKISLQNFYGGGDTILTFYSRFSLCNQIFFSIIKEIVCINFKLLKKNKMTTSYYSNCIFSNDSIKFPQRNNSYLKDFGKEMNFKKNNTTPSSCFQNLILFSSNYLGHFCKKSFIKIIDRMSLYKISFSFKISIFFNPIIEYTSHTHKKTECMIGGVIRSKPLSSYLSIFDISIFKNIIAKKRDLIKRMFLNFQNILQLEAKRKRIFLFFVVYLQKNIRFNKDPHNSFLEKQFLGKIKNSMENFFQKKKKMVNIPIPYYLFIKCNVEYHNKLTCKFLKCGFRFYFHFFPTTSTIFFEKINLEILMKIVFVKKKKILAKKQTLKIRNSFWKYIKKPYYSNNYLKKDYRIFEEIIKKFKFKLASNSFIFILLSLKFTIFLVSFFKPKKSFSFKMKIIFFLGNFKRHLCSTTFSYLIFLLIECLNPKKKGAVQFRRGNTVPYYYLFLEKIIVKSNPFNYDLRYKSKVQLLRPIDFLSKWEIQTKLLKKLIISKIIISLILYLKIFIFSNYPKTFKSIKKLVCFKIKNWIPSSIMNWIDFLKTLISFFSIIKFKIYFLCLEINSQIKFKIFNFFKSIYNPFQINLKVTVSLGFKNFKKIFKNADSSKCFGKKKKISFIIKKENIKKLLESCEQLNQPLIFPFKSHFNEKEKKLKRNKNFIFKSNNLQKNMKMRNNSIFFGFKYFFSTLFNYKIKSSGFIRIFLKKLKYFIISNIETKNESKYINIIGQNKKDCKFILSIEENFAYVFDFTYNDFLVDSFYFVKKFFLKNKKFKNTQKYIAIFNTLYLTNNLKKKINKNRFFHILTLDLLFILHLYLKILKSKKNLLQLFTLLNTIKIVFKKNYYIHEFESYWCLLRIDFLKKSIFQKIKFFSVIIFYKKLVSDIFILKKKLSKRIRTLLKFFIRIVSTLKSMIQLNFDVKLETLKIYLKKLTYSKKSSTQNLGLYLFKKLIKYNISFLFTRLEFSKIVFLEIFKKILNKNYESHQNSFSFFRKKVIQNYYFKNLFKILLCTLNLKESEVQKNSKISLCSLILSINNKFSIGNSKKFLRKLFFQNYFSSFRFNTFFFLLVSILLILGLNLKIFITELNEFSKYVFGIKFFESELYQFKSFSFDFQKIQDNVVNFYLKQKKKTLCCNNKETFLYYNLLIKYKIYLEFKTSSGWSNSLESLNQLNISNLEETASSRSPIVNYLKYRNLTYTSTELYHGNLFLLNLRKIFYTSSVIDSNHIKFSLTIELKNKVFSEIYFILGYYPSLNKSELQLYSDHLQIKGRIKRNFKEGVFMINIFSLIIEISFSIKTTPSRFFFWIRINNLDISNKINSDYNNQIGATQAENFLINRVLKILILK